MAKIWNLSEKYSTAPYYPNSYNSEVWITWRENLLFPIKKFMFVTIYDYLKQSIIQDISLKHFWIIEVVLSNKTFQRTSRIIYCKLMVIVLIPDKAIAT